MALSPSVAPHPASRRRSYSRLQAGVGIPGEDLHLPDQLRLQAHGPAIFANGDFHLDKGCFLKVKIATYLLQLDKMLNNDEVALLAV
jgi:hypothetical protein